MLNLVYVLLVSPAVIASPASAADFKCGTPSSVILVDGERVGDERYVQVRDTEAVHALHVACWSPRDSTLSVMGPGIPFYEVLTESFVEKITSRLTEVQHAQRSFVARRGRFGSDLNELGLEHLRADGFEIVLSVEGGGWTATATRGLMVHRCSVAGGRADADGDAGPSCVFDMKRKVALPTP